MDISNLDTNQSKIINYFNEKKNLFISGPAGTGKSHVIRILKNICDSKNIKCQVTALTGCASLLLNCNAKTIHSWSGINIVKKDFETIYKKIYKKKEKRDNWKDIEVLIIDEVSMMSKNLFNLLDYIGKKIRKNEIPFGGIQLVFSGDFYQLPPVNTGDDEDDSKFCFESDLWNKTFHHCVLLDKIFRQSDIKFSKMLNQIRIGKIKKSTVQVLQNRIIPYDKDDSIKPTKILSNRKTVTKINQEEHNKLPSKGIIFNIESSCPELNIIEKENYNIHDIQREKDLYEKNFNYVESLEIKIGDQVICNRNISDNVVNGSRGVVIRIDKYPVVRFLNNREIEMIPFEIKHEYIKGLSWKQVPLNYAWALTIHKCQGISLDLCIMDIGNSIFECGQTYVALSRVKNLEGLYLTQFNPCKILVNSKVTQFYENLI